MGVKTTTREDLSLFSNPEPALAAYQERGYHIEYDVWSPEECEELIQAGCKFPEFTQGTFVPLMHPHRTEPTFLKALRSPKVVRAMELLLGGRVSGIQTEFFFGRPGTSGFSCHQDNAYVQAKPDAFGSAWSPLVDVSRENGGLIIYPGTHREPILPVEDIPGAKASPWQDPNAHKTRCVMPPGFEPVHVIVPAGSVVFIHAHLVHSSNDNSTKDRTRQVLLCTYIRKGETFRAGNYAKRAEVDVY